MGKTPELTPEEHAKLNQLAEQARVLRLEYAKAVGQHRKNIVQIGILKGQKEDAQKAHREAYKALGLSRQREWQRERTSQGQCRSCGNPALSGRKHCPSCDARMKTNALLARKARNLVEQ